MSGFGFSPRSYNYSYISNSPLIYIFSRLCPSLNSRVVALHNDVNVPFLDKMNMQSGLILSLIHI